MLNHITQSQRQSGIALLTVLLIVFLASTIAVSMISDHSFDIRRADYNKNFGQSYHLAMGVEAWALGKLHKDAVSDKNSSKVDHQNETWGEALSLKNINNIASIYGTITDSQARFNINNLYYESLGSATSDSKPQPPYQTLLLRRLLKQQEINADLTNAIIDWVDKDNSVKFPMGAENPAYLAKKTPYRTAGRPIAHISELRLIKGITPAIYNKLKTLIVALPLKTQINVNTAPKRVLLALTTIMTDSMADNIIQHRKTTPFKTMAEFTQFLVKENNNKAVNTVQLSISGSVNSDYFVANARIQMSRSEILLSSLIWRDTKKATIKVYRRTRGLQ